MISSNLLILRKVKFMENCKLFGRYNIVKYLTKLCAIQMQICMKTNSLLLPLHNKTSFKIQLILCTLSINSEFI